MKDIVSRTWPAGKSKKEKKYRRKHLNALRARQREEVEEEKDWWQMTLREMKYTTDRRRNA